MKLILNPNKDNLIKKIGRWFKPSPYLSDQCIVKEYTGDIFKLVDFEKEIYDNFEKYDEYCVNYLDLDFIPNKELSHILEETKDIISLVSIQTFPIRTFSFDLDVMKKSIKESLNANLIFYNKDDYAWFRMNGLI